VVEDEDADDDDSNCYQRHDENGDTYAPVDCLAEPVEVIVEKVVEVPHDSSRILASMLAISASAMRLSRAVA